MTEKIKTLREELEANWGNATPVPTVWWAPMGRAWIKAKYLFWRARFRYFPYRPTHWDHWEEPDLSRLEK